MKGLHASAHLSRSEHFSIYSLHAYVAGEEGPSLMGLEDLAMFRALPTATIFYPSDGVSTEKAVELAATARVREVLSSIDVQFRLPFFTLYIVPLTKRVCATSAQAAKTVPSSTTAMKTSTWDKRR